MIEVAPSLFVGNQIDYEKHVKGKAGWAVVHACKEPYHREAVGYTGRGLADRDHPEYLVAVRGDRLMLNMIDAPKPEFFRDEMMDAALTFIEQKLHAGLKVLIHCNQGGSRAPSLALLFLRGTQEFDGLSFEDAETALRTTYPAYEPAAGIRGYVERKWNEGPHDQAGQGRVSTTGA